MRGHRTEGGRHKCEHAAAGESGARPDATWGEGGIRLRFTGAIRLGLEWSARVGAVPHPAAARWHGNRGSWVPERGPNAARDS